MKRLIHIQVPASMPVSQQQKVGEQVAALIHNPQQDSVFLTPQDVVIHNIPIEDTTQISGVYVYPLFGIEDLAKAVVQINADYCAALGEQPVYWEQTEPDVRVSILRGIASALRFNPTPEQNHQNFIDDRTRDGWTYGPEKNVELKQHPDLIPWEHLPADQKIKNTLFLSIINTLKPKLPPVAASTKKIVKHTDTDNGPESFQTLNKGDVFHFEDAPDQVYRATSEVYINYLTMSPQETIEIEMYKPEAAADQSGESTGYAAAESGATMDGQQPEVQQ